MSAQHTPGPWRLDSDEGCCGVLGPDGFMVADCTIFSLLPDAPSPERWDANARLIAAAPDLLALAYQYASECGECAGVGITPEDEDCAECRFIRVVINKAKGAA